MPYVSQETIDYATRILTNGTPQERKEMITTTPILPPSGGISTRALGQPDAQFKDVVKLDYSKLKIDSADESIMFIKLRAVNTNELGAVTFAMKHPRELRTQKSRRGWIPAWWLPWQSKHIVKIKIRDVNTNPIDMGNGVAGVDNPDIFFTAAINGCSVFAVGATRSPSMYHAGVDGPMGSAQNPTETTEEAWERLVGRAGKGKNIQSIGKTNYISELIQDKETGNYNRLRMQTKASMALEAALAQRGRLTKISVHPWGMVFGLRDNGGAWTMTLVKNALVMYHRIEVKRKFRFFQKPKRVEKHRGEFVRSRFYNDDGTYTTQKLEKDAKAQGIRTCVNLGYQDFFPGAGRTQIYDVGTVQVF